MTSQALPGAKEHIEAARAKAAQVDGMGGGIAMNFLTAGIPVTIVEAEQANLHKGVATIRRNYENSVRRGKMTAEEVDAAMARLTPTLEFADLGQVDLVIEAVYENMDLKKQIFARLDKTAKPGAILASNTSYLNIDEMAEIGRASCRERV